MITTGLLTGIVLWLAYSNGANDNFKGVATLWGSGVASFRTVLGWATATTAVGGLISVLVAAELAEKFKGKGLVPPELLATPELAFAVGGGAAATILLATLLGMPTSTTHALVGGLLGASLAATGGFNGEAALSSFFAPLLVSPALAVVSAAGLYPLLRRLRRRLGIERATCLCVGRPESHSILPWPPGTALLSVPNRAKPVFQLGDRITCMQRYPGRLLAIEGQTTISALHFLSGGAVCFSRAVNDTPKIAALLLVTGMTLTWPLAATVTAAMTAGGLLQARKVAVTMSRHITALSPGKGLTANLITAGLVLGASKFGLPVSMTHVSCGSIFGIGLINRRMEWRTVTQIATAWVTTLPLAALLGGVTYKFIQGSI